MDGDGEGHGDQESRQQDANHTTEPKYKWFHALSASFSCIFIILFSFISVNLVAITLQWVFEGRRFYSIRQVHRAIFDYYKNRLYLWYLMIRNWDCHEDGKIKVIMPNYLAS